MGSAGQAGGRLLLPRWLAHAGGAGPLDYKEGPGRGALPPRHGREDGEGGFRIREPETSTGASATVKISSG